MKLPEIFKNKLDDNINNNKKIFIGNEEVKNNRDNIDIFEILPVNVTLITTKGEEITTTIIGKTKNYIITKNRKVIYIKNIKSLKKAN